ncbi:Pentatricopeptide repeat [Dillenia turbinata]|uniref:Pentatricopeptide repeat n=1 Tax=Dillenia turbinata TaxID=194707 RepID=A0AAN8ULE7_9MAGN
MATNILLPPLLSIPPQTAALNHQSNHKSATKFNSPTGSLKFCKNMSEIKQFHAQLTKTSLHHSASSVTKLISACAEIATFESLDYAKKAFELFRERSNYVSTDILYMCNSLIRGYSFVGLGYEAMLIYAKMVAEGILGDKYTYPFVLSGCTKNMAFYEGVQLHGSIVKMGLEKDAYVQNSLIHFYCECGDIVDGRKVFAGMSERNVVSWTSLICGYGRRDLPSKAVSLFFEMVEAVIRPNEVTMVCVVSACAKLQDLGLAERLCAYIRESGVLLNTHMVNALVDMYMKCGATDNAKRLFDECAAKNLVLYNTLLSNYEQQGLAREALVVLNEMLQEGMQPDRVTMLSAISASAQLGDIYTGRCCHGYILRNGLEGWDSVCNAIIDMYMKCGQQDRAFRVFDNMKNKSVVSWNSLIAGLLRNGDVVRALELFNNVPETDLVSWNTIISGLVQEGSYEEAIEQFRMMQAEKMKADRVTMVAVASACGYLGFLGLARWIHAYIDRNQIEVDLRLNTALIDMYARRWIDVAKVRLHLKEKGVCKIAGVSSIEVNGIIHEFTSGDESHPVMRKIEQMLNEMNSRLMGCGHIPDLSNVLLDVDEHEKEYLLTRASICDDKMHCAYELLPSARLQLLLYKDASWYPMAFLHLQSQSLVHPTVLKEYL